MGWSDNIAEIIEIEQQSTEPQYIVALRKHVAELKKQLVPLKDCCNQHKLTATFADQVLDICVSFIEKDSRKGDESNLAETIVSLIGGTGNILAFLLHLVPTNEQRRSLMGEVINISETMIKGLNPEVNEGTTTFEEGEFEVAPGIKVKGVKVKGSVGMGKDAAQEIGNMIAKLIAGDATMEEMTPPKNKLN